MLISSQLAKKSQTLTQFTFHTKCNITTSWLLLLKCSDLRLLSTVHSLSSLSHSLPPVIATQTRRNLPRLLFFFFSDAGCKQSHSNTAVPSSSPPRSPPFVRHSTLESPTMDTAKNDEPQNQNSDELAESLNDLFSSVCAMVKSELQGTNNQMELLEKMNVRVAEEYKGFGDLASGLRIFVEQLKCKSGSFNDYVEQIDAIEKQVTEFEAMVSMLDKHVSLLESKVQSVYQTRIHRPPN